MKRRLSILIAVTMLLLLAGTSLAETTTNAVDATASATAAPANGNQPSGTPGLMGKITAIGDNTITITVGGNMQPPQGGDGQKSGNNQQPPQGGNGQQGGTPPQGGNGQQGGQPSGTPPQGNQNGQTTTEEKSVTITVTDTTTYTMRGSSTAIAFADLTVGMTVSVTATGDDTTGYIATAIEADASQPADSTATTATSGT